jgi:cold shock CspA family protein
MDEIKEFVVKKWTEKGYGFACEPNGQEQFYVHASSIISAGTVRLGSCIRARVVLSRDPGKRSELADVEVLDASAADENGLETFVVVQWNPERGIGTARPPHVANGVRNGLFFGTQAIITLGAETLRPGSRIRGRRVPDPKYPDEKQALVEVEIYAS